MKQWRYYIGVVLLMLVFGVVWVCTTDIQRPATFGAASRTQTKAGASVGYVTSYSITMDSSTTAGNTIVCAVAYNDDTAGTASLSDNKSNTWTKIAGGPSGGDTEGELWYSYNINGGASHQITVTFSANNHDSAIICREYSGLTTSDPLDKSAGSATAVSTSHTSASTAATTQANELVVAAVGVATNATCTAGAGYGNVTSQNASDLFTAVCMEDKDVASTGAQQATITTSASAATYFIVATFKEASSGGAATQATTTGIFFAVPMEIRSDVKI